MSPAEISAYGRDVVTRLGGKPAALVTDVNLKALIDAGNALAGVATDIATAQQPGQPIASLQVAWNQALTGWRTAQVALRPRLREFLVGGLPEIPGLSVLASGMDWDRPEGLRGNLTLGPVSLAVDSSALLFPAPFTADSLALGPFRPNTFAASFGGALGGGGALQIRDDGITGVLRLALGVVEVSALASLRRIAPGNDPSFLAIIGVGFTPGIQLGFGFAITRIGGLVGANRAADVPALTHNLRGGTAGDVLFAENPVRDAARLIPAMEQMFRPSIGAHLAGPTFQLSWLKVASASFFTFQVGVIIELPGPARILILGMAKAEIPGPVPLLRLRLDLLGWIDFARREIGFDATLVDSGALGIFTIAGDAVFRVAYGDRPYTLLTIGGFYPGFNPEPALLPRLSRVALALDSPAPGVFLRAEAYFAVTSNTLQLGGNFEAGFQAAGVEASGFLGVDALIQFTPFHFHAECSAGFRVRVAGRTFSGVRLDGTLDGPGPVTVSGKLTIETFLFDISWHETFTLGQGGGDTRIPAKLLLDELAPELTRAENLRIASNTDPEVVLSPRPRHDTKAAISPRGELQWIQGKAPLGIPVDRVQGVPLGSVQGARASSPAQRRVLPALFSPGSYITLTNAEALNRPAFDLLDAGLAIGWAADREGSAATTTAKVQEIRKVRGQPEPDGLLCADKFSALTRLANLDVVLEMLGDRPAPAAPTSSAPMITAGNEQWKTADGQSYESATAAHQHVRHGNGGLALAAADMARPVKLAGV